MTWSWCILRTTNVSQLGYHSLLLLWNNYTIHRLMHLWIHKLSKLSIPRVWNLPSTQSIDCRICQSVDWGICQSVEWESANCTIHWLNNLSIHDWQIPQYTDCVIGTFCTLQINRFFNLCIVQLAGSSVYRFTDFAIYGLCSWWISHSRDWHIPQFKDS